MDRPTLFDRLARHRDVFRALLAGLKPEDQRWKPAPEKWCILEVVCHLRDEEREDFGARLRSTLLSPEQPWPKIDPVAWATERRYMEQDFETMLAEFLEERERTVHWLNDHRNGAWHNAYPHPQLGPVSCDLLLANWVAHDLHHIRQINNLRYGHLASISTLSLDYAGQW